jgi:mannose-6-phosphate isomerase-like protein (cupin superfamily)
VMLSLDDDISGNLEAMTKGFLNPGFNYEWHHHDDLDEFFVVLQGEGGVLYKDDDGEINAYPYNKRDVFYMPAGVSHEIQCVGSETSEYFFVRINA